MEADEDEGYDKNGAHSATETRVFLFSVKVERDRSAEHIKQLDGLFDLMHF